MPWTLMKADEFDAPTLDPTLWNVTDFAETSNNELEYYRPQNVSLANSCLILTAKQENYGGRQWTSGSVDTHQKLERAEGAYEARIKYASVPGTWPAFWMFCWPWPDQTEKDIFEYFGKGSNRLSGAIHWNAGGDQYQSTIFFAPAPAWFDSFHVYRFEFVGDSMKWLVDGVLVMQKTRTDVSSHWDDFKRLNHIEFNLAIGGSSGTPDPAFFPTQMFIDYLRVYDWVPDPTPVPPIPPTGGAMVTAASYVNKSGSGWNTSGTEIYNNGPSWVEYDLSLSTTLTVVARNNGSLPPRPGYVFNILLTVDGVSQGAISLPGSQVNQSVTVPLVGTGVHRVRLNWVNDDYAPGQYDANLRLVSLDTGSVGAPPLPPPPPPPVVTARDRAITKLKGLGFLDDEAQATVNP